MTSQVKISHFIYGKSRYWYYSMYDVQRGLLFTIVLTILVNTRIYIVYNFSHSDENSPLRDQVPTEAIWHSKFILFLSVKFLFYKPFKYKHNKSLISLTSFNDIIIHTMSDNMQFFLDAAIWNLLSQVINFEIFKYNAIGDFSQMMSPGTRINAICM